MTFAHGWKLVMSDRTHTEMGIAEDVAELITRTAAAWNLNTTHYAGCWMVHPMCMAVRAANELIAVRGAGDRLAAAIRRTPCDCSPTCTCGNLVALTNWETLNRD